MSSLQDGIENLVGAGRIVAAVGCALVVVLGVVDECPGFVPIVKI